MKIKVKLINQFKQYGENKLNDNNELEIIGNCKVKDLLNYLEIPQDKDKTILVNGRQANLDQKFKDGDKVVIYNLIAGG